MSPETEGPQIRLLADLDRWLADRSAQELAEPFTFVVDLDQALRLAPRRSEHVACAGGGLVFSAGEMRFTRAGDAWNVLEVTNQSAGYCPDADSWPTVAACLDRLGIMHPGGFTHTVIFRRCTGCQEHNVVHDEHFTCAFCGSELPETWNVDAHGWVDA